MKQLLLMLAAFSCLSCANITTSAQLIDADKAIISGRGSAQTNMQRVVQDMLVEAAATTASHGYSYFVILGGTNTSAAAPRAPSGQMYPSGTDSVSVAGMANLGGGDDIYSDSVTVNRDQTASHVRPGADITIQMYRDEGIDPEAPNVWDARNILAAAATQAQ